MAIWRLNTLKWLLYNIEDRKYWLSCIKVYWQTTGSRVKGCVYVRINFRSRFNSFYIARIHAIHNLILIAWYMLNWWSNYRPSLMYLNSIWYNIWYFTFQSVFQDNSDLVQYSKEHADCDMPMNNKLTKLSSCLCRSYNNINTTKYS